VPAASKCQATGCHAPNPVRSVLILDGTNHVRQQTRALDRHLPYLLVEAACQDAKQDDGDDQSGLDESRRWPCAKATTKPADLGEESMRDAARMRSAHWSSAPLLCQGGQHTLFCRPAGERSHLWSTRSRHLDGSFQKRAQHVRLIRIPSQVLLYRSVTGEQSRQALIDDSIHMVSHQGLTSLYITGRNPIGYASQSNILKGKPA
jgi:hypothetical protein